MGQVLREARYMQACACKNVAKVYGVLMGSSNPSQPVCGLLMEHVEGPDLLGHLRCAACCQWEWDGGCGHRMGGGRLMKAGIHF